MPKIIATIGLPASGKDTWASEYIAKYPQTKRVNKDLLREMLDFGVWSRNNEKFVLKIRDEIIENALTEGHNIIVSDTNLEPKHILRFKEIAKSLKSQVEIIDTFLNISPEECIKRDLKRSTSVGDDVIWGMYNQYVKPKIEHLTQNSDLPNAVIFDMDGTLAKMKDRSPYEWNKVDTDDLNQPVYEIYKFYKTNGYKIIIFTARDAVCEELTKNWLALHKIEWDYFDIRPADNTEKDAVIKLRMVEKAVEKYHISAVFDDRDQVVKMWRELGLQCFQVADGGF